MGREVINIRSSDIVAIIGGRSGTLGELAISYDEGKLSGGGTTKRGVAKGGGRGLHVSTRPGISTILKASLLFSEIGAFALSIVLALRGDLLWAAGCISIAVAADIAGRAWSRRSPVPMPYFMRWVLHLPRGPQSPRA